MDPASLAILAAAGISSAGALYANSRNSALAREQLQYQRYLNDINLSMAQDNNATQIALANSAHQREVADLKAAGLNPILSAGGHGAATPSLTTANGHVTSVGSPYENPAEGAASSARSLARYFGNLYDTQIDQARADVNLTREHQKSVYLNNFLAREETAFEANKARLNNIALQRAAGYLDYDDDGRIHSRNEKQFNSYVDKLAEGYMSSARLEATQALRSNWRLGLDTLNGAGSLYRGLKGNPRNVNYYNW